MSVTLSLPNCQLKSLAKWNPTTSRTAADRRKSRLKDISPGIVLGLGLRASAGSGLELSST